ncbi:hypothetical protein OIU85_011597 [Salix viminalis]|uniref:Uncharacterized protein n=1 Tax=Salix viminalis TaxID=40686 RepID=A0A9Q0NT70_SALVM|nr:hypothetical protein OIU85_011597 [Salix viminalis]
MQDRLVLQEIEGENGIKKEEMGMSPSHEDVQAAQLGSLWWRRWRELCTATPALAKTCSFRLTAKPADVVGTGYSNQTRPKPVESGGWISPVKHLPAKMKKTCGCL